MTREEYLECVEIDPDITDQLAAARLVSCTEKGTGGSSLEKLYRRIKDDEPGKFLDKLAVLERNYAAMKKSADEVIDLGTEVCEDLLEKLILEFEALERAR